MTVVKGQGKGQTVLGIYALEGETLKLCYALPGRERPKTFTTAEGSGTQMRRLPQPGSFSGHGGPRSSRDWMPSPRRGGR